MRRREGRARHFLITLVHEVSFRCFDASRRASLILSSALLEKAATSGSAPSTSAVMPGSPLFPPSCPGTPPAQDDGWRQTCPRGANASPAGAVPLIYCLRF